MESVIKRIVKENGKDTIQEIHRVVVYKFSVADVDDPEIYAAEPIMQWQDSDSGKFVMKNSVTTPMFHKTLDHATFGYRYAITAELEKKKYSEFLLRFGKNGNH